MTILVLRTQKGAPLTFQEVDANFLALAEAINQILTGQSFTDNAIAPNAGIAPTKIAGTAVVNSDPRLSDQRTPPDGSITDAKVAANAGILPNKIAGIAVINSDPRLADERVPTNGSVTNAKVANDAAIEGTKIAPDFGSQTITTTGSLTAAGIRTIDGVATFRITSPTQEDVTATLTAADLKTRLIVSLPAAAITLTLPTGATLGGGFSSTYQDMAFQWSLINTSSAETVTLAGNTDHGLVGDPVIAAESSALFLTRRDAVDTFVTYRMA